MRSLGLDLGLKAKIFGLGFKSYGLGLEISVLGLGLGLDAFSSAPNTWN